MFSLQTTSLTARSLWSAHIQAGLQLGAPTASARGQSRVRSGPLALRRALRSHCEYLCISVAGQCNLTPVHMPILAPSTSTMPCGPCQERRPHRPNSTTSQKKVSDSSFGGEADPILPRLLYSCNAKRQASAPGLAGSSETQFASINFNWFHLTLSVRRWPLCSDSPMIA